MADKTKLYEDQFEVLQKDPDGKKFDRVSRFVCKSELFEFDLTIDINTDIYPLKVGDKFALLLAKSLYKDGSLVKNTYDQDFPTRKLQDAPGNDLMTNYDYVMCGKVFKYSDSVSGGVVRVGVYVSFGGLLMKLVGDPAKLEVLGIDSRVFLLMRKISSS